MDSRRLASVVDFLLESRDDYRPHQVVVARHGRRVLDVALYPFPSGVRHDLASVGKVITGTLIGIAIDKGFIASAEEKVLGFFPDLEIANRDARKEALTIADLLAQRSGIDYGPDGAGCAAVMSSSNPVQATLDRPMLLEPGAMFEYCSANTHLAAAVLARATGVTPLELADRYLFGPLRIKGVVWETDPQGINVGSGGQILLPLDLAKLGELYLRGGVWEGQQVVSKAWVGRATSPVPGAFPPSWPVDSQVGFHWVIYPDHYEAGGSGGQNVFVSPEHDLVLVVLAGGGQPYHGCQYPNVLASQVYPRVCRAILADSPLPANPSGVAALAARVATAAEPAQGPPSPVPPLPATAGTISGKRFVLEENPLALDAFTLSFPGGSEATIEIEGEEKVTLKVGLEWIGISYLALSRVHPRKARLRPPKGWRRASGVVCGHHAAGPERPFRRVGALQAPRGAALPCPAGLPDRATPRSQEILERAPPVRPPQCQRER
jgi:CubicO group peptidase (beta-lactamase class C family)